MNNITQLVLSPIDGRRLHVLDLKDAEINIKDFIGDMSFNSDSADGSDLDFICKEAHIEIKDKDHHFKSMLNLLKRKPTDEISLVTNIKDSSFKMWDRYITYNFFIDSCSKLSIKADEQNNLIMEITKD